MHRSKRFQTLSERDINRETFVDEWPEVGLIAMDSPVDPTPSLQLEDGQVAEVDGRRREAFDLIDRFIAEYAIDREQAEEAMNMASLDIARMVMDPNVPREEVVALIGGCTPTKLGAQ